MKNEKMIILSGIFEDYIGYELNEYHNKKGEYYRFIIPDDEKKMLLNTKTPKKSDLFKLPFKCLHLDVSFENEKIKIPYGFFLSTQDDFAYEPNGHTDYAISFAYIVKGTDNIEFIDITNYDMIEPNKENMCIHLWVNKERIKKETEITDAFFEDVDTITEMNKAWKLLNLKQITSFICNYLLFLNDPRVRYVEHKGHEKKFKKNEYHFQKPRHITVKVNNELQRYIDNFKKESEVNFKYNYKFIVRGHFRKLRSKRYKNPKTIWVTPYYKGKGLTYKKDYVLRKK